MDDLRARLARLDRVAAPDLWPEIERRATHAGTQPVHGVGTHWSGPRLVPSRHLALGVLLLAATVAIAATLIVGGAQLLRSNEVRPPIAVGTPAPSGHAAWETCADLQVSASRTAVGWTPVTVATAGSPGNGWIATWNGTESPRIELVDPISGVSCETVAFPDLHTPLGTPTEAGPRDWMPIRGGLSWSPDGRALAIVAADEASQALFVWSADGVAGPFVESASKGMTPPTWSPDGSHVAVVTTSTAAVPSGEPTLWIVDADGTSRKTVVSCGACYGGRPLWSGDSRALAVQINGMTEHPTSSTHSSFTFWSGVAVGPEDPLAVASVDGLAALVADRELIGWTATNELIVRDQQTGRFVAAAADGTGAVGDDIPVLPAGAVVHAAGISPDGTHTVVMDDPVGNRSNVVLHDLASGTSTVVARGIVPGGPEFWSPDGRTVGYLVDTPGDDEGIWLVAPGLAGPRPLVRGAFLLGSQDPAWIDVWQPMPR